MFIQNDMNIQITQNNKNAAVVVTKTSFKLYYRFIVIIIMFFLNKIKQMNQWQTIEVADADS